MSNTYFDEDGNEISECCQGTVDIYEGKKVCRCCGMPVNKTVHRGREASSEGRYPKKKE